MMRQYVSVTFRPDDARSYSYHNDGEPLAPGQTARVESSRGEQGWQLVYVASVTFDQPEFETKPILAPDWVDRLPLADAHRIWHNTSGGRIKRPGQEHIEAAEWARIEKKASKYAPPAAPELFAGMPDGGEG